MNRRKFIVNSIIAGFIAAGATVQPHSAQWSLNTPRWVVAVKNWRTIDRNRLTGEGVTAGIDLGLIVLSILQSDAEEKVSLPGNSGDAA